MNARHRPDDEYLPKRFYVTEAGGEEREVTMDEYCRAEALAGFRPKQGLTIATASFSGADLSGRTEY